MNNQISVEVAYATREVQLILTTKLASGANIKEAIYASSILSHFPEIDLKKMSVGIFSQTKQLTDKVKAGDRIEIYRPLLIDPKEARRKKAR